MALAGLMCGVLSLATPGQAAVEDYLGDYQGSFSGDTRGHLDFFVDDFGDVAGTLTVVVGKRDSIKNGEENDLAYDLSGTVSDRGVLNLSAEVEDKDGNPQTATLYSSLKITPRSTKINTRNGRWYTSNRLRGTWSAKLVPEDDD
ncbi:MAG TPA: hypothetical protein VF600_11960 [Abditibacteriaceae bacterium]